MSYRIGRVNAMDSCNSWKNGRMMERGTISTIMERDVDANQPFNQKW
jgi:hypothetical protein